MDFLKRAFLQTTRKKGKSLLLFFVLLVISTLILTCFAIRSATDTAALNVRESLGGSFTLNAKRTDGQLTGHVLDQIAAIPGVEKVDNARSESYAEYKSTDGMSLEVKTEGALMGAIDGFEHAGKLQSNVYSEKDEFFTDKGFELLEGRHITKGDENVALIHEDFAELNGLAVGDTFILDLNGQMLEIENYESTPVTVEVIGIYTNTEEQEVAENVTYTLYENTVFTDPTSFTQLFDAGRETYYSYAEVLVNDPAKLDSVVAEMKTIEGVDWDASNVTYHDTDYQNAKESLETLGNLVSIAVVIIIVVSIVLLALILTLWVRGRIHETGVFMSMGFGKVNIFMQHVAEIMLVAILAFALSFATSSIIAQNVGNTLLEQTTAQTEETADTDNTETAGTPDSTGAVNLTELNISISPIHLLFVYVLGTLIIVLSVAIATIPIMKMKPKEILSSIS